MSKVFMITDTHFGVKPLDLKKWMDIQFDFFYKQFIPYLRDHARSGDILVHGGDLFDNRTSVPIIVQNKVEELLIQISKILPVHIIVGNHDNWNKGDNSINSPKIFRHLDGVYVYEKTTKLKIEDTEIVLMPWVEYKDKMIEEIENSDGDYLICHSDLNGCKMHLSSVAHRNKNKIEVDEFKKYKRVFSGHIHIRQVKKNFEFIGSPYQMDRNDYNDKKGFTILDLEKGETKFIENEISPTFKKFKIESEGDILLLEHLNTNKHFVDLQINNSVLVGKRKNRKLLESHLSNKKFSSVEYNNDLKKENNDKEKLKEVEIDDIKIDDFGKLILDYTENQNFETKEFKEGVKKELKEILLVHNQRN